MKNRTVFKIAFFSLVLFVIIATYFWYLFFKDYAGENQSQKVRLELINNGGINYINAVPNDIDSNIPVYYFRVRNNVDEIINYEMSIEDVSPDKVNDGCSSDMLFARNELNYELKLDNKIIKSGVLSELSNNLLDNNEVKANSVNDYSLKIWLNTAAGDDLLKHYHYVVNIKEIK